MGKKSKAKMREMQEMNDPNLDLMAVTPPTTQTTMSYATAVKKSETGSDLTNSCPTPAPRMTSGEMKTKGDGSYNLTQHPVSPMKVTDADVMNPNNGVLPKSPSPNSDPLMLIRASLENFELPALTESSESDGEFHSSTFRMSPKKHTRVETLSQEDAKFIRCTNSRLTNISMGLDRMISTLSEAVSQTEDNLRNMRRTVRRLDREIPDSNIHAMMYADLSDTMIKSFTRMLHAFWTQLQKLETHHKSVDHMLRILPKNRLQSNAADLLANRKNRRRKQKGNFLDDKQLRDPATSTHPTGESLPMMEN